MKFLLIGRTGPVFVVAKTYLAAGFIPAYHGVTEDGKRQTHARVVDVEILPDVFIDA